ncbi:rRNA maturation RNase YbeY [Candidatus Accumulibacter phosphatis]|jgi:probable rRNA maturation factor|uniref:Endoribonuclease YbeY n=1 Tax=Candidatus Accumulibacter phosphatis TaxID=327160 RepID=A0ABX1TUV1_9PROT|nr:MULTISPECIES: rRNA maturation RNase YbeY [Candidatus Accumulibacter]NMQ27990.1 rRNA maturation RNase YbeY [Candidatus Accumulibacter phosphatis]
MPKKAELLEVEVQYACDRQDLPKKPRVRAWARAALAESGNQDGRVTVRFVAADEGRRLNREYRSQEDATNVLSFPYALEPQLCGDLVLCVPVVAREAAEQDKSLDAHYAHLVVHGMLHLQGHDHEESEEQASAMEDLERSILADLGYPDPYGSED